MYDQYGNWFPIVVTAAWDMWAYLYATLAVWATGSVGISAFMLLGPRRFKAIGYAGAAIWPLLFFPKIAYDIIVGLKNVVKLKLFPSSVNNPLIGG